MKLRESAGHHDACCMFEIAGVCQPGAQVLCHIRFPGAGGLGIKPDDLSSAAFGCFYCHNVFDQRAPGLERLSADWYFYAIRALSRQIQWWRDHGFITVTEGDR